MLGRVFCNICEASRDESVFATTGSINVKKFSLIEHGGSKEHQVKLEKSLFKKDEVQRLVARRYKHADVALFTLFWSAYFVGKSSIPYSKFLALYRLIRFVTSDITTKMYHDDKSCAEILFDINLVLQQKVLEKVRASPFFRLMIDESTNISSTCHLVVFCLYLDEGRSREVFLGLLHVAQKDSALITTTLMSMLNEFNLDFKRCVGFGSDGTATMIRSVNGVAQHLKCLVNPHLLSCHCVAHHTNLVALTTSKVDACKEVSDEVDVILNQVVAYFHYSSKHKVALSKLQVELADARNVMKRYLKIRWLSRHAAISTLADSLESVLQYWRDVAKGSDEIANLLFLKLSSFRMIYILYFLADILGSLAKLRKIFQQSHVDVTIVGLIVSTTITQICMNFIMEVIDLNVCAHTEFHLILDFGPPGGFLKRLQSEIICTYFHSILMNRDKQGSDLNVAVAFQKSFAKVVCNALEAFFSDNDLISCLKILNPHAIPSTAMGIQDWGFKEIEQLCEFFRNSKCAVSGISRPALVDGNCVKTEYRVFKIQCMSEWHDRSFHEVWQMISTNPSYSCKYANLLKLVDIARVQCVSIAICEHAFSIQNSIKTKARNSLQTKHLESCIRVAIEDDYKEYMEEAIIIWKRARSHRYLFSNLDMHLPSSLPSFSSSCGINATHSSVCNVKHSDS